MHPPNTRHSLRYVAVMDNYSVGVLAYIQMVYSHEYV